jgi:hypothetical protein
VAALDHALAQTGKGLSNGPLLFVRYFLSVTYRYFLLFVRYLPLLTVTANQGSQSSVDATAVNQAAQMTAVTADLAAANAANVDLRSENSGLIEEIDAQRQAAAGLLAAQEMVSQLQRELEECKERDRDRVDRDRAVADDASANQEKEQQEVQQEKQGLAANAATEAVAVAAANAAHIEEWKASYAELEKSYSEYKVLNPSHLLSFNDILLLYYCLLILFFYCITVF